MIGFAAPGRRPAAWIVVAGWIPQVRHYAVLVPHGEDDDLWGVPVQLQLLLAATVLEATLVAHDLKGRARRRRHD